MTTLLSALLDRVLGEDLLDPLERLCRANQCSQLKGQLGIQRTADLIRLAIGSGFGRRNNY